MNHDVNPNIIYRYLAGECTSGEERRVLEWMNSSEENRETMKALRKIWSVEPRKELESDIQLAWKHLEERLEQREHPAPVAEPVREPARLDYRMARKSGNRGSGWIKAAAILALVVFGSLYVTLMDPDEIQKDPLAMTEVTTERGQRAQVVLDDGSRARLNADSKISYPEEFGTESRSVYLTGEAYFEVVRDGRPFFVHADEAVIEILGTEFNVMAYEEEEIQVVVAGGKVAVRHQDATQDQTAFLVRGDMARLNRDSEGHVSVTRDVNLSRYLGWLDYRLEFDATPLEVVVKRLERWYEMDINMTDSLLADLRVTAVFEDESIDEILEALELSLGIEYRIEGRQITLRKGQHSNSSDAYSTETDFT